MKKCLVCNSEIKPFANFGKMPIANGFLSRSQFKDEPFFELEVGLCPSCYMIQLTEVIERETMFNENYAYYSSISTRMANHFKEFATEVMNKKLTDENPFVVEIGCNDGIMLRHFAKKGYHHLGIEPSANVAAVARKNGIDVIVTFFEEQTAKDICRDHGKADVILGANVMCHIPYLHSVIEGVRILLKPEGVLIFEDPYLGDIIEKTSYDQIYDEHAFYFSLLSLGTLFSQHNLEIIDVSYQNVHGGSMRYTVAHAGAYLVQASVLTQRQKEKELGLEHFETYTGFYHRICHSRDTLISLLHDLKTKGKRIVGYGATSKSTTVTNFCGISPDLVEFISDTTPTKQGKYSPGVHIPIKSYEEFRSHYPDYAILFAWNHGEEIIEKETSFRESGGKFILYVPIVNVI
jgi:methylation protein EvaC